MCKYDHKMTKTCAFPIYVLTQNASVHAKINATLDKHNDRPLA